jgi:alpha 1,6-mannosyltransferase
MHGKKDMSSLIFPRAYRRIAISVIASACLFFLTSHYFSGMLDTFTLRRSETDTESGYAESSFLPSSLDQANHYAHSPLHLKETAAAIPRTIWQIYSETPDDGILEHMDTWFKLNPDCSHHRLSKAGAIEFISRHYAHRPDLVDLYTNLKLRSLNSDLLRYMILATEGGVYADMDVSAEKPIKGWVPKQYRRTAKAVVGLEYDRRDDSDRLGGFFMDVQFCQWTMAAGPGHPMLISAVEEVAKNIYALAERQQSSLAELEPSDDDVLNTTGPAIWSRIVFESLSVAADRYVGPEDVSGLQEPVLFGDILVMPIDAFATNVGHSGAGEHEDQALIRHGFRGSWRGTGDQELDD